MQPTVVAITPEADEKLEKVGSEVKLIIAKGNTLKVESDEDDSVAVTFLGDLKEVMKEVEDSRTDLVKPLNDTVKKINNAFKLRLEPMQKIDAMVRARVKAFRDAKEKAAFEEAEKIRKQQEAEAEAARIAEAEALAKAERARSEKGKAAAMAEAEEAKKKAEEAEVFEAPVVAETSLRTENALSTMKKIWKFEVINQAEVPQEYLMVDEKKVGKAIREGMREIKGIRIYQDSSLSIR